MYCRVNYYIQNGWADQMIINPDPVFINPAKDDTMTTAGTITTVQNIFERQPQDPQAWQDIKVAYQSRSQVPSFSHGQMITYFVSRTVSDGLPAGDFKAMNIKAKRIFDCGHIQNIQVCTSVSSCVWLRADCLPEMKKNITYKIILALSENLYDIESAKCGCKAGKGPKASCKHIGAMCYAFAEFCKSGKLTDFLTCTEKLQEWNKPRPKKVEILPVVELTARRQEILKKPSLNCPVPSNYDPRPSNLQQSSENLTEK